MRRTHQAGAQSSFDAAPRIRYRDRRVDPLLITYLWVTTVLVITPGSTTAVVVRHTLSGGRSAGLAAAAGAAIGNTAHATAAGLGLAVVFARWPLALTALRVAGAGYLAWLGLASLYRAARFADAGLSMTAAGAEVSQTSSHRCRSFRQGVAVNILNPAIATFYLLIVPSFLPAGAPRWYFAMLAAIHVALAFTCHGLWAIALGRMQRLFRRPHARRLLEGATGVALIGLAGKVILN